MTSFFKCLGAFVISFGWQRMVEKRKGVTLGVTLTFLRAHNCGQHVAAVTLTFDLLNIIRSSLSQSGYLCEVWRESLKAFLRYRVHKHGLDGRTTWKHATPLASNYIWHNPDLLYNYNLWVKCWNRHKFKKIITVSDVFSQPLPDKHTKHTIPKDFQVYTYNRVFIQYFLALHDLFQLRTCF